MSDQPTTGAPALVGGHVYIDDKTLVIDGPSDEAEGTEVFTLNVDDLEDEV